MVRRASEKELRQLLDGLISSEEIKQVEARRAPFLFTFLFTLMTRSDISDIVDVTE
jgi:hypothetical protein